MSAIVVKIGGSLLDLPDLGTRLGVLFARHASDHLLLFPGGGDAADLVRGWQSRFGLTDAEAHELAIASLDFNAALLARITPGGCVVRSRDETAAAWSRGQRPILAPSQFLSDEEQREPAGALPQTWHVTSDSLAAWTAIRWPSEELWLGKSVPCPAGNATVATQDGAVDPYFSIAAGRLQRVGWCNVRDEEPRVVTWRHSSTRTVGSHENIPATRKPPGCD